MAVEFAARMIARGAARSGLQPKGIFRMSSSAQTPAETELAQLLVESLNLDGVDPAGIDPEAPLFNAGLGLDSIDALELALAISQKYGFQLRSDNDDNRRIFASLRALSAHVEQNRAA
jgi:acyl carrier protein